MTTPNRLAPRAKRRVLARIIRDRDLRPAYQPIVDVQSGAVVGVEALCRPGAGAGIASAAELFQAGERTRMLWPLEHSARSAIMEGLTDWPCTVRLFLNCSPHVVCDGRFLTALNALVSKCPGLDRAHTVIELTERGEHGITPALLRRSRAIKEHGYELAMDDVGAGMSGLSRIMALRPHWLKLDMDLVRGVDLDPLRRNLIAAIAQFARASKMRVVAEGVEHGAELEAIIEAGLVYAQGHYLSPPREAIREIAPRVHARAA